MQSICFFVLAKRQNISKSPLKFNKSLIIFETRLNLYLDKSPKFHIKTSLIFKSEFESKIWIRNNNCCKQEEKILCAWAQDAW